MSDATAEPVVSPSPPVSARPNDLRWILVWTAIGLAIRAIHILWLHPVGAYLWSDMAGHFSAAQSFANPDHIPARMDVIKPRAMGILGSLILRQFGSGNLGKQLWGLLQVILSTATLPLAFLGTRRFFGRRAASIAIVILALDAASIAFAGFLMVETYAMFCLALTFALLAPERPWLTLLSGAALGLAGLFKPQVLPLVPLWCLLLFCWPEAAAKSLFGWLALPRRISAVLFGVGVLAVVIPESVAVSRIVGRPTLLSAYSGQNFYIGHCNVLYTTMIGGPGDIFTAGVPKVYERNEPWPDVTFNVSVFDSDFYFREGMKCWRKSFWASVLWSIEQLADVFAGWPGSTIDPFPLPGGWLSLPRYFAVILEYLFVPLALAGLWQQRRDLGSWIGFGAPLGAIWGLAIIFSGDPRYREPFDIFIVAGAAAGLERLLANRRARRGMPAKSDSSSNSVRARVHELLKRHGWNASSFQTLAADFSYWFDGDDACVGYVDTGHAWVAAGAPIAPRERMAAVASRFIEAAQAEGRRASFFGTEDRFTSQVQFRALAIGEQPVWDPRNWTEAMRSSSNLREQLRRARAKGVTVRELLADELAASDGLTRVQLEGLMQHWLEARPMPPMRFLVQLEPFTFPDDKRCWVAEREGKPVGLLVAVPIYQRHGWLFENLLRDDATPNGTTELLVASAMGAVGEEGCSYVTLGLVPLSGPVGALLRTARFLGRGFYDFDGLRRFKTKLRPTAWNRIFLSVPGSQPAALAILDVLGAFAGGSVGRFGWRAIWPRTRPAA